MDASAANGDEQVDVAVVGAGFGGLALAALAADAGLRVAVLERRARLEPEGVGLVLQPNGLAVLDRLRVLDAVLAAGQRITTAQQCDDTGRVRAQASYAELDHPQPYVVVIERTEAIAALAARLPSSVSLRFGAKVAGLVREDARVCGVRLEGGGTLRAALVVGADGGGSAVRDALAPRVRWRTGPDRYLIGISERPPAGDAIVLYCGDGWCDGIAPLRGRTYFFDHLVGASAEAVERGDFDAWRASYAGRVPEAAEIGAGLRSFADVGLLSGRTHVAAPRAAPGVALVGDAAAAVHPHNGQGANLALEDARALGEALAAHGPRADEAIARYAKARDRNARRQVPWSIFIGRTFDGPHAGWRAVRRNGYVMSRIPFVRRQTTRRQAGL